MPLPTPLHTAAALLLTLPHLLHWFVSLLSTKLATPRSSKQAVQMSPMQLWHPGKAGLSQRLVFRKNPPLNPCCGPPASLPLLLCLFLTDAPPLSLTKAGPVGGPAASPAPLALGSLLRKDWPPPPPPFQVDPPPPLLFQLEPPPFQLEPESEDPLSSLSQSCRILTAADAATRTAISKAGSSTCCWRSLRGVGKKKYH